MKGIIIVTVTIIAIVSLVSLVITYAALSVASYWDDIEERNEQAKVQDRKTDTDCR